ncbi:uncharacterized protein LOC132726298 [Ruditapes philippinarum]|uniref:uncharacterized protein LOC132726298 n=1 Tax=Ruditapes philippinarum TaxID=129788 RepID=UPI00295AEA68|nr:uncharacterized protein LOC132726298 [Ruditapes philippinarum]
MSMLWKGIPVPVLVAIILLIVGGLIHIVGIATPYWHSISITNNVVRDKPYGHHGLWAVCTTRGQDVIDCNSHSDTKSEVVATRALEVLALLFGAMCIIITGLWFFLRLERHRLILMISSLGSGFISALFGFIGIIIYAADVNSNSRVTDVTSVYNQNLDWSFAMCVISSILVTVATILIGIGTRMVK